MPAAAPPYLEPSSPSSSAAAGGLRWVHDPDDDQACLHQLGDLHDLAAGRLVCHPTPEATWPVLVRDLFEALGKRRDALPRARRDDAATLLRVWLRAEQVEHLVVLRAHRLHPPLLAALAELATATGTVLWLVWHDTDPPPSRWEGTVWSWSRAITALRERPARRRPRLRAVDAIHRDAVAEARREARLLRVGQPRQRRFTQPGCQLGALLQRMTIDAATDQELALRLDAAQAGFATEGLTLVLPTEAAALSVFGPHIDAHVVSRLRRLACPTSAAALLLAQATDCRAGRLSLCAPRRISPDFGQVGMLTGIYRIPATAGPLLHAALLDHQARGLPYYALFTHPAGGLLLTQRMANLIARAAALAGLPRPLAATRAGRSDSGPEAPFAATLVNIDAVRIEGLVSSATSWATRRTSAWPRPPSALRSRPCFVAIDPLCPHPGRNVSQA